MDIVLGVSMAPATIGMVLVEGENADGLTVDEDNFDVADADAPATLSAPDQVIAAILGTREGATEAGYALTSTGVTWTDPADAAALAAALAARKVENVMLVSAFLAAAALAQTVGCAIGYQHTALLFVEPGTATLAVVASADGSVTDVHRRALAGDDPVPELAAMITKLDAPETLPAGSVRRGLRGGYRADQAGARGDVASSGQHTRRAGDGAGPRGSAGIGQRAAVRLLHRRFGVRARSRHRSGGPVCGLPRLLQRARARCRWRARRGRPRLQRGARR